MKRILLLIAFLMLSSMLFSIDLHTGDEYGTVVVKCESLYGLSANAEVMINQSVVIIIKKGHYVKIKLNPGEYLFHAETTNESIKDSGFYQPRKVLVEAGKTKYYAVKSTLMKVSDIVEVDKLKDLDELKSSGELSWISKED